MKSEAGTYVFILRNRSQVWCQIGRWGKIDLEPGYYLYVGSAFGPGGVQARVLRHCRRTKLKHWHIDYLREFLSPVGVWFTHETIRLEHHWAQILSEMKGFSSIRRFGCSDCTCYSHLFQTSRVPELIPFSTIACVKIESWSFQRTG